MRKNLRIIVLGMVLLLLCTGCGKQEEAKDYPACFQNILQQREDGEAWNASWDLGVNNYLQDSPDETITLGYADDGEMSAENNYEYHIKWMKLGADKLIENITIDLSSYMEKAGFNQSGVCGVFYEEEKDTVYIVVCTVDKYTWLVEFQTQAPEQYTVTEFPGVEGWFGYCYRLQDTIYLTMGAGSAPWAIDMHTKEAYQCIAEYEVADEYAAAYKADNGESLSVCWFYPLDRIDDTVVYIGHVQEAMDTEILKKIYLAYEGQELIGIMVTDERTGESEIDFDI